MSKKPHTSFSEDFRIFFFRGLATLLPTILTIFLLIKCYDFVQVNISRHITDGLIWCVVTICDKAVAEYPNLSNEEIKKYINVVKPHDFNPNDDKDKTAVRLWTLRQKWNHEPHSLVGFVLAIMLVYIIGRLLASYLGHSLWSLFEKSVQQVPGFKQVYPYIKQVTDFLFGENKIEFNRVVVVPYPRKGLWSLGLVTGDGLSHVSESTGEQYITVFIPSSPTPVTGYIIQVPKHEAIDLPITIEEAIRFTVSGGVISPDQPLLKGRSKPIQIDPVKTERNPVNEGDDP